ncbi:MAG TPA: class II aldolase/adducin family protein [Syntrophaceticus sp.]|jgi:L-fuculose-phosphate aldolase|nr:class II aldolase/adducin family protein [Syntrophaceticus schinkii]MDD4261311.1 class II aldolase/adducin family protein [Syntrophaceticus schinkii]MDD4674644.1 class II aldolase/adducin family protein [Syntrophaceticus schinkii]HHY29616.1 class II aldolase/adducin family protein [Syntrophaceticus sp.]
MIPRESEVQAVLETGKIIINSGLVSGTWGNISVRLSNPDSFLITPSGVPYHELTAEDLVIIDLQGEVLAGRLKPSSETPLHAAIYRARQDINGIVHTHSSYASVFTVTRKPLPPVLEEMAQLLGGDVRVAPYAPAGTDELAAAAVSALGDRAAVLLANHGVVGVGRSLREALLVCQVVEKGALVYLFSQLNGTPFLLSDHDVSVLRNNFLESYGQGKGE